MSGRAQPASPGVRTAILKGGGELENLGDVMMRHQAEALIRRLGFTIAHRLGHGDLDSELPLEADSVDALFVLGSIQFSDAWPHPTLLERLERAIRVHRHFGRARVVFRPATWGAFRPEHASALGELIENATVLVRDRFSADCINRLLGRATARYCPDLAFGYPSADPELARPLLERTLDDPERPLLGIVPNQRCVEPGVTPLAHPQAYVDALARVRDHAIGRGFNVVGISHMLHTERDLALLRELGIVTVPAEDPAAVRSVVANLTLCVCSRYHGVISCLSHAIPVLALGWHHKYANLMHDMALDDYHVSVASLPQDLSPVIDALERHHEELRQTLARKVSAARDLIQQQTSALTAALC
ncbi:MAG: polysaccharide pyruvyl transferase family protein [Vicinamibacterales bacterium]